VRQVRHHQTLLSLPVELRFMMTLAMQPPLVERRQLMKRLKASCQWPHSKWPLSSSRHVRHQGRQRWQLL
jgi:hypothetical protein